VFLKEIHLYIERPYIHLCEKCLDGKAKRNIICNCSHRTLYWLLVDRCSSVSIGTGYVLTDWGSIHARALIDRGGVVANTSPSYLWGLCFECRIGYWLFRLMIFVCQFVEPFQAEVCTVGFGYKRLQLLLCAVPEAASISPCHFSCESK